jgi:four helix bundle protein
MENKQFAKQLETRTLDFAIEIIKLSSKLPNFPEARIIKNQITKSGTSIGANYREANRARSRNDFKNRVGICESEAAETQYWLEVIVKAKWLAWAEVKSVFNECSELLAVFTSIGRSAKKP